MIELYIYIASNIGQNLSRFYIRISLEKKKKYILFYIIHIGGWMFSIFSIILYLEHRNKDLSLAINAILLRYYFSHYLPIEP